MAQTLPEPITLGRLSVHPVTMPDALGHIMTMVALGEGGYIVTSNVDNVFLAERDDELLRAYECAPLVLTDGQPLVWLSRLIGRPIPAKVRGSDITMPLLRALADARRSVFFLGATQGVRYATAIKAADPSAIVAGPASWGWPAYFYSAADAEAGFSSAPDREAHGDTPLLAWHLQQMKAQEAKGGKRLLDVLDIHFYPQQLNVYGGGVGGLDAVTAKLRIRSMRALWDPSYSDESWIGESINLLPRMRKLIDENYPGTGLSIGEWSFGGEGHMSGGLATAIALGRFGTGGVTSAFYWTAPPADSPTFWAFRAFRNFDGKGGRFLDSSVEAKSSNDAVSVFASTNEATSELVTVIINTDPTKALDTPIVTKNCRSLRSITTYAFDGAPTGFRNGVVGDPARIVAPAYSIAVVKGALR